jgi:hypothetical protein
LVDLYFDVFFLFFVHFFIILAAFFLLLNPGYTVFAVPFFYGI